MRDECEHGSLRRSCEICERDAEIADLRARLATAERERDEAYAALREFAVECETPRCRALATREGDIPRCDRHGSDLPDEPHAAAIRAAEKSGKP